MIEDDRSKRLQDYFGLERRQVEISGHQSVRRLPLFACDGVRECRHEAADAVALEVGVDIVVDPKLMVCP